MKITTIRYITRILKQKVKNEHKIYENNKRIKQVLYNKIKKRFIYIYIYIYTYEEMITI